MISLVDYATLALAVDDQTLEKLAHIYNLPRGWGTTYQDGPKKGVWYRRKRNGYHDLLQKDAFKSLIKKWPLVFSVSNHDGTNFNNFQSFAIYDFDNSAHPDDAKEPLEKISVEHDKSQVTQLASDSGGKGYHIHVFFSAPIHTKDAEKFQDLIIGRAALSNTVTSDGKIVGFIRISDGNWAYFNKENPYDPTRPILNKQNPENNQHCTIIELLTSMGEGKMIKSVLSRHPKYENKLELPMTVSQIMKHNRSVLPTVEDVENGCNLIKRLKVNDYQHIIDIAQIIDPRKPGPTTLSIPRIHTKVRFTVPNPSPELDAKCTSMFERIISTPCLQRCYEASTSLNGTYYLRTNLVTAFACMGYTREEIGYFFKYHINDDADNANKGILEFQIDYWYNRKYSCRCEYWQETDSNKFCCDDPCGRRSPAQIEPEPNHIHLTRTKDFEEVYQKCKAIIHSGNKRVIAKKTTRAGFTTAMTISAVEEKKKILFLVPRTAIAEQTFGDTICLAKEKRGVIINGFVISANHKYCLKRLQEKVEWEKAHGKPLHVSIPVPREDCKHCPYNGTIVQPGLYEPLYISDIKHETCAHSTYALQRGLFDVGFTTYAKLYAILNTPSEESLEILKDLRKYDIIVFDEISQFVESSFLEICLHAKHRHDNLTYSFVAVLNKQLNDLLQWVETGETVDKIHRYLSVFMEEFENFEKFKDGDEVKNPLSDEERTKLKADMIVYLNHLYNYALISGNDVGAIYNTLSILSEEKWYTSKIQTMDYIISINFVVPPKYGQVVDWLKGFNNQVIITDATMPFQNLKDIFGQDIADMPIGDPLETAKTQLIICDSINLPPTRVFGEAGTERLTAYLEPIRKYHKDGFMVATSNTRTRNQFVDTFKEIPADNCTWQRSNKTIGVANNLRAMVTISQPYAPNNAFDWLSMSMVGDRSLSLKLWKVNCRNSMFQTIGRVKDPLAHTLSVVYTYGSKKSDMENLLKDCNGVPQIIDIPIMKDITDAHTIVADYWLRTRRTLGTNQIKVLVYHRKGYNANLIREKTRLDAKFIAQTIEEIESA